MSESLEQIGLAASASIADGGLLAGMTLDTLIDQFIQQPGVQPKAAKPAPLTLAERRALVEKPFPPIGSIRVVGSRYHHAGIEIGEVVPYQADDMDAVIISIDRKRHRGRKPSMSDYEDR